MAGTHTYEEAKKMVFKGLIILAVVTLIEVFVSLFGKGHLGIEPNVWLAYLAALIIVVLSIYKAYFIIFEFMHLGYEVRGMAMSVLLPTTLLIWAIIAFLQEGNSWGERRDQIQNRNELPVNADDLDSKRGDTYELEN